MNKTAQRVIKRSAPLYKGMFLEPALKVCMCLSLTHANARLGAYCKGKRRDGQVGLTSTSMDFRPAITALSPLFYLGGNFVSL